MLTCSLVRDVTELERLRAPWRALLARSAANEPTRGPAWALAWWRVFGHHDGRELRALAFTRAGRLVGLAPLLARAHTYAPGVRFQRLELVATGEREADETCSDYVGVLAERGREREVAGRLAEALVRGETGPWDELVLGVQSGDDPLPALLGEALERARVSVSIETCSWAPYVPLPSSWEAYLRALPTSHRSLVRRSLRQFEAWAGEPPRLERVTGPEELRRGSRVLIDLHRERWATEGRRGVFDSAPFRAFHGSVMPELLAAGALDLGCLRARGEPVAAFYNVVWGDKVYFYQSGRRVEGVPPGVRLGIVMHACAIRDAIAAGRREYDFLAGASRYKLELALARRPLLTLRAARPSWAEALRAAADVAIGRAREAREALRRRRRTAPGSPGQVGAARASP
ncbi:MAG TPA: GNAT family N-acetyltransferase [Polyangiaceae bacterium]|nr:GNAT family N-acetyltransferase [Polyangiaceae bacterium]